MKIKKYKDKYGPAIRRWAPLLMEEYDRHGDVMKETACVACHFGQVTGFGFLMQGNDRVNVEFAGKSGKHEVEASCLILQQLARKGVRVWCRRGNDLYYHFLEVLGFREDRAMNTMELSLQEADFAPGDFDGDYVLETPHFDEAGMHAYAEATGLAFGTPDSEKEMWYRLKYTDAVIYTVSHRERIAAALTVYPLEDGTVATENIFTVPEYRRRGIMTCLMKTVLMKLKDEGFQKARLTVLADNEAAIALYERLGYNYKYCSLEMVFSGE